MKQIRAFGFGSVFFGTLPALTSGLGGHFLFPAPYFGGRILPTAPEI